MSILSTTVFRWACFSFDLLFRIVSGIYQQYAWVSKTKRVIIRILRFSLIVHPKCTEFITQTLLRVHVLISADHRPNCRLARATIVSRHLINTDLGKRFMQEGVSEPFLYYTDLFVLWTHATQAYFRDNMMWCVVFDKTLFRHIACYSYLFHACNLYMLLQLSHLIPNCHGAEWAH